MRKQRAAAGGLINEFVAQRRRVDRNEQQVVLTLEMPGGRFDDLVPGRK